MYNIVHVPFVSACNCVLTSQTNVVAPVPPTHFHCTLVHMHDLMYMYVCMYVMCISMYKCMDMCKVQ